MAGAAQYKKRAIPAQSRRDLALRYGCLPGEYLDVACPCGEAIGTIAWFKLGSGRPGAWVHFSGIEVDHIQPEYLGGSSHADNLQLLCQGCNRRKGFRASPRQLVGVANG